MSNNVEQIIIPGLDEKLRAHARDYCKRNYSLDPDKTEIQIYGQITGSRFMDEVIDILITYNNRNVHQVFKAHLKEFTGNCGMKSIAFIYCSGTLDQPTMMWLFDEIEKWIFHHRKAGVLVGSDYYEGNTIRHIRTYGKDYKFSEEVHNPNYPNHPDHKIQLFWKYLHG